MLVVIVCIVTVCCLREKTNHNNNLVHTFYIHCLENSKKNLPYQFTLNGTELSLIDEVPSQKPYFVRQVGMLRCTMAYLCSPVIF